MIKELVNVWDNHKDELRKVYESEDKYYGYECLIKNLCSFFNKYSDDTHIEFDTTKIHTIDDGHWQGTILFIIPEYCYQPDTYYCVKVWYGSCSHCDTLQRIMDLPNNKKVDDIMTLSLHMLQDMKII
jgi:hypothetical protein